MLAGAAQPSAAQKGPAIAGIVRDGATGQPVEAVRVTSGGRTATTDRAGRFELLVSSDTATLQFSRLGYRRLRIPANRMPADIRLAPEPVFLTSLVVQAPEPNELAAGTALAVTAAGREQIGTAGGTSLAERLSGTEGISVQRWSSWGATTMIRGLGDDRVAVMIDGARVNRACPFFMDQGLATVDPATVERVEVLAGPGSTLYGSGNIGGVINVVTRRPDEGPTRAGELRLGASTAVPGGSIGASIRGHGSRADFGASLDGTSYGDYRSPKGRVGMSSYRDATGEAHAGLRLTPAHRVDLQLQGYDARDIGYAAMGARIPRETRLTLGANYGWQLSRGLIDAFSARAYIQRFDHRMTMDMPVDTMAAMPGMPMAMEDRTRATTTGARAQLRLMPWATGHVDAGVEATAWNAEGSRFTELTDSMGGSSSLTLKLWPGVDLTDVGAFAQGETRFSQSLALSAGGRVDRIGKKADDATSNREWVGTGNVGLRAGLPGGFEARASFGAGYRVPSPSELFGLELKPDGNIYRGDATLRTETNRNVEATLAVTRAAVSGSVTAFRNDLRGMISPSLGPDSIAGMPILDYRNVASARMTGATSSVRLHAGTRMIVSGTAAYTRGENRQDGNALPRIPPFEWGVSTRHLRSGPLAWIEAEMRGAMRQARVSVATSEASTKQYAILNLRSQLRVAGSSVVAGVENALDRPFRSHVDPSGLLRPGRNIYLRMTRSF